MRAAGTAVLRFPRLRPQKPTQDCGDACCKKNVATNEVADEKLNQHGRDRRDEAEQNDHGLACGKRPNRNCREHNRQHYCDG
jgi:hypothetical protein